MGVGHHQGVPSPVVLLHSSDTSSVTVSRLYLVHLDWWRRTVLMEGEATILLFHSFSFHTNMELYEILVNYLIGLEVSKASQIA